MNGINVSMIRSNKYTCKCDECGMTHVTSDLNDAINTCNWHVVGTNHVTYMIYPVNANIFSKEK